VGRSGNDPKLSPNRERQATATPGFADADPQPEGWSGASRIGQGREYEARCPRGDWRWPMCDGWPDPVLCDPALCSFVGPTRSG